MVLAWEDVDLYELCQESITRLGPFQKRLRLHFLEVNLHGSGCKTILSEMIGNLAIMALSISCRGKVFVRVIKWKVGGKGCKADTVLVSPFHIKAVFLNVYRVDKSHSKEQVARPRPFHCEVCSQVS